jgi:hypothetical protein
MCRIVRPLRSVPHVTHRAQLVDLAVCVAQASPSSGIIALNRSARRVIKCGARRSRY